MKNKIFLLSIIFFILLSFNVLGAYTYYNETTGLACTLTEAETGVQVMGIKFIMNQDAEIYSVHKGSTSTATRARLCDTSSCATVYDTATFSGNNATFSGAVNIPKNTVRYVIVDGGGSAWTSCYTGGNPFPMARTNLNYTSGVYRGSDNTEPHDIVALFSRNGTTPPVSASYNLSINTLSNINTSKYDNLNIGLLVTPLIATNMTRLNGSVATLYYLINTSLNNGCSVFYQNVCQASTTYKNKTMSLQSNVSSYLVFNTSLQDNEYYTGYYPFNYQAIGNTNHTNYLVYINHDLRFNIFNMSTSATYYLNLEFNAMNLTNSGNLLIYYCNNSYINGNPNTNINCQLVDSFTPTGAYNHNHNNITKHQGIPVVINTVTKTQNSSFIFVSNSIASQGWNFEYMTNSTYNNQSFVIGNYNTWSYTGNTPFIFDMHLHPIGSNDRVQLYATFNDNNGTTNTSTVNSLFYNISYQPPSAVDILIPNCTTQYTLGSTRDIEVYWTNSTSQLNYPITYELYYRDEYNIVNNQIEILNTTSYNWSNTSWNSYLYPGNFEFYIISSDGIGSDTGYQSCTFNICENDYITPIQPCLNGLKFVTYTDDNNCNELINFPSDNNTYINCTSPPIQTVNTFKIDFSVWIHLILLLIIIASLGMGLFHDGVYRIFVSISGIFIGLYVLFLRYMIKIGEISGIYIYFAGNIIQVLILTAMILVIGGIFWLIIERK